MAQDNGAAVEATRAVWKAWALILLGWVVPGGGHFALRRWGRGAILAACVVAMFLLGLALRGKLYQYNPADFVETAGWLANLGAVGLYAAARFFGYQVPEPPSAVADYGTKFLLTAGLLNVLLLLDVYDLATGKKS
jgi:hypothetical protein